MRFAVYQLSRKGGRQKNEDRMGYCYTRASGLFVLADGMGGHPEGEVASELALQILAARCQSEAKPGLAEPLRFLQEAVIAAHHQLLRYATERAMIDTPRTTVVACVLQGKTAYWAHCGDSRLYLVRNGKLVTRTRDHSYVELQQSMTKMVPKAERANRNVLFTCLGSPSTPVIDTAGPVTMQTGDRVLLCSDGLWDALSDADITKHLAAQPITDAVPELVKRALRAAGAKSDNVTALAVEWESAEDAEALPQASTKEQGGEVFASTIQASLADLPEHLDEAEIDRSIREINDAIERSNKKRR